jgi:hypothetical protein
MTPHTGPRALHILIQILPGGAMRGRAARGGGAAAHTLLLM